MGLVNPLMLLHWVFGLFDEDAYQVDFAVKLRIESVDPKRRRLVQVAEVVIPIGKLSIDEIARGTGEKRAVETGFFPKPAGDEAPSNVTVTVVEANDLGDVIAESADFVGVRKRDITETLKEALGLD